MRAGPKSSAVAIVAAFLAAWAFSGTSAAANRVVTVSITNQGFSPAVVVVPTGTTVLWRNNDTVAHGLSGQVTSSGMLPPGATYERRFTTPGQYQYHDASHPDSSGTVVVTSGGTGAEHQAPGDATHDYTADMKLTVDDRWTYYDPQWGTTSGACNSQVGTGETIIHLDVRFPDVMYVRNSLVHVEVMADGDVDGRFSTSDENVSSKLATDSTPMVTCPDGIMENSPTQPADCFASYTGKRVRLSLGWTPAGGPAPNRFVITNSGPMIRPVCGASNIVGSLALVGVKEPVLPLNLVAYRVDYDEALTSPATPAEVRALRAGRAFTVSRGETLDFTTPCCEGFNPGSGGVLVRTANIDHFTASLTISFSPRG